jgi:hypothetical protein
MSVSNTGSFSPILNALSFTTGDLRHSVGQEAQKKENCTTSKSSRKQFLFSPKKSLDIDGIDIVLAHLSRDLERKEQLGLTTMEIKKIKALQKKLLRKRDMVLCFQELAVLSI